MNKLIFASTKNADVRYILGNIIVPDPFFLIQKEGEYLMFVDHREFGLLKEKLGTTVKIELLNPLLEQAQKMEGNQSLRGKLAIAILSELNLLHDKIQVPTSLPLDIADAVRDAGGKLEVASEIFPERATKTLQEVESIRQALLKTHRAFRKIEEILGESKIVRDTIELDGVPLTSEIVKKEIDRELFEVGLLNLESSIVSCGEQAAVPHHPGEGLLRPNQTIICDIFPTDQKSGFCADMTRTYVKGKPSDKVMSMYGAVKKAQQKGISEIRAGVRANKVHEAVCSVFRESGFEVGDIGFVHGTGHGLGLEIHEEPYINATSEATLEAGNVVTVEPWLYYTQFSFILFLNFFFFF